MCQVFSRSTEKPDPDSTGFFGNIFTIGKSVRYWEKTGRRDFIPSLIVSHDLVPNVMDGIHMARNK